jgi:hypothetical protein
MSKAIQADMARTSSRDRARQRPNVVTVAVQPTPREGRVLVVLLAALLAFEVARAAFGAIPWHG